MKLLSINNLKIFNESIIAGVITYLNGIIAFNLIFKNDKETKPFGINLVFFITGILLNVFTEIFNMSKKSISNNHKAII